MLTYLPEYGPFRAVSKLLAVIFLLSAPAYAEPVKIVALGDSLTAGYGLAAEDGFVPQMQAFLDNQGVDAVIVNAGVSGDTSAGGLERANWVMPPDVDGLILALGANDMLRGFSPKLTRRNLSQIIEIAQGKEIAVLLVGIESTQNFGPTYKASFDGIYAELQKTYGVDLYENFMAAIARDRDLEAMRPYMQRDGLHPNADGVGLIVGDMGWSVMELIDRM
ncbi:MAG: arylesterase [Paracoccaceae bacterium]|nr:arylesterase [Paracoccaceae bacterium]MDP7186525.1 arylesterase [Paracoccaceae bacterium]